MSVQREGLLECLGGLVVKDQGKYNVDGRDGTIHMFREADKSLHFAWKNPLSGVLEKDIVIKSTHTKCKVAVTVDGLEILVLRTKHDPIGNFFWVKDSSFCARVNEKIQAFAGDHDSSLDSSVAQMSKDGSEACKGQRGTLRRPSNVNPASTNDEQSQSFAVLLSKAEADEADDFNLMEAVENCSLGRRERIKKLNNTQLMGFSGDLWKKTECRADQKTIQKHSKREKQPQSHSPKSNEFQLSLRQSVEEYCNRLSVERIMPMIVSPVVQEIIFACLGKSEKVVKTEAELRAMTDTAEFHEILQGLCLAVSSGSLGTAIQNLPYSVAVQHAVSSGGLEEFITVVNAEEDLSFEDFTYE